LCLFINSTLIKKKTKAMKKTLSYLLLAMLLLTSIFSFSQDEVDALRFSQIYNGGTSRYVGMGGAFGAIGGDLSTAYSNPAGIGVFRTSQFTFTPNLVFNSTSANFLNETTNDYKTNFNINNIGYLKSFVGNDNDDLVAFNWGFIYNRTNNFNFNEDIMGVNNNNSITDFFADNSNGYSIDELNVFRERLAWETYSINSIDSTNYNYVSALENYGELQRRKITKNGYSGEFDITFGINIKNKFYWGSSIGFSSIRFNSNLSHYEQDTVESNNFNYLIYNENLKTYGSGINFKTGIIYKPLNFLRIGAAIHSPTYLNLTDNYSTNMEASFDDVGTNKFTSPDFSQRYAFNTPGKFLANLAFVIGKSAIIGFDYEFLDYSWGKYGNEYDFYSDYANRRVNETYTIAHNFKLGAEYRLGNLSLRAGAAYYGSPFKTSEIDSYTISYSGGFGLNFNNVFLDFAYLYQNNTIEYYMYTYSQKATISSNSNKFMATLGFRF